MRASEHLPRFEDVEFVLGWRLKAVRNQYRILIKKDPMDGVPSIQTSLRKPISGPKTAAGVGRTMNAEREVQGVGREVVSSSRRRLRPR